MKKLALFVSLLCMQVVWSPVRCAPAGANKVDRDSDWENLQQLSAEDSVVEISMDKPNWQVVNQFPVDAQTAKIGLLYEFVDSQGLDIDAICKQKNLYSGSPIRGIESQSFHYVQAARNKQSQTTSTFEKIVQDYKQKGYIDQLGGFSEEASLFLQQTGHKSNYPFCVSNMDFGETLRLDFKLDDLCKWNNNKLLLFSDPCPPCLNGGTCIEYFGQPHCKCTIDFTGEMCETKLIKF